MNRWLDVLVVTKDRPRDLMFLLESLKRQAGVSLNIHVVDDGSQNPVRIMTNPAERDEFRYRITHSVQSQGPTAHRLGSLQDPGLSNYVAWLDDDLSLPNDRTLSLALRLLESNPQCAAAAIPLTEPLRCPEGNMVFPQDGGVESSGGCKLRSFLGGSVILNKSLAGSLPVRAAYKRLGGEEHDLAIRILESGWSIQYSESPPVCHWASPIRDLRDKFRYDARSALLFEFLNMPLSVIWRRFPARAGGLLLHGTRKFGFWFSLWVIMESAAACLAAAAERKPVSAGTWQLMKHLPRHGVERVESGEDLIAERLRFILADQTETDRCS